MDWRGTRRSWEDWIDVIDANTSYFHATALCLNVTNISTIKLQFRDGDKHINSLSKLSQIGSCGVDIDTC